MEKKLRAYFWHPDPDDDHGLGVVAFNSKNAKKMAYKHWASEIGVEPETWINQRIKWKREANVEGLTEEKVFEPLEGLRRNIYGFVEEMPCDKCGEDSMLQCYKGKALCERCVEFNEGDD